VPWPKPSSAASIWPVWLESSSIACLPVNHQHGLLASQMLENLGHRQRFDVGFGFHQDAAVGAHGERCADGFRRLGRSDRDRTISLILPFSFSRTASSTAISSKGFIDIFFTLARSTPLGPISPDLDVVVDHPLDGHQNLHGVVGSRRAHRGGAALLCGAKN